MRHFQASLLSQSAPLRRGTRASCSVSPCSHSLPRVPTNFSNFLSRPPPLVIPVCPIPYLVAHRSPNNTMAEEDLYLSTATQVGLCDHNMPDAAPDAPRPPMKPVTAAESHMSPEWTFTELSPALKSGDLPEHTQPRPTDAVSDTPAGDDYDPGYTDNDALCATCRLLLQDHDPRSSEFNGWKVNVYKSTSEERSYKRELSTKMTWTSHLETSLFDQQCPLCCELRRCRCSSLLNQLLRARPIKAELAISKYFYRWEDIGSPHLGLMVEGDCIKHLNLNGTVETSVDFHPEESTYSNDPTQTYLITTYTLRYAGNMLSDEYAICGGSKWADRGFKVELFSDRAIGTPGPFAANTGSDLSWQLVRSWMAKCLSSHQLCNRMQAVAPLLPTRVIDVGSRDGKYPPRLYVPAAKELGCYATLSHCWGSKQTLKLETTNFEDFKREIPWERLPKTFQDAIAATRHLGIQYIWIDSICIIQDSPNGEDWATESAKMTSVYENSYINLAAASAVDSTQGCFFDRDPCSVRPVRLLMNSQYYYAADSHRYADNVALAPLYARGWVYQERTLAPRIVHCTTRQLYWECLEGVACEGFPSGIPHFIECYSRDSCRCQHWRRMMPPASDIYKWLDGSGSDLERYFESLLVWNRVAAQFQPLKLTYTSDKLVAISGLAKMHSRFLKTRYLAGMWLEHLPAQLLWYRRWWSNPHATSYKAGEYVAPSWSYFSMPNRVEPAISSEAPPSGKYGNELRPIIQVLDAKIVLVNESHPFGAVSDGALRIKGPLANSSLIKDLALTEPDSSNTEITYKGHLAGSYTLDNVDYPSQLPLTKPIYFLPVMLDMHYDILRRWTKDDTSGLLLQQTAGGDTTFQRVGVFAVGRIKPAMHWRQTEDGIRVLQEACCSQNGPDDDGPFPEWGKQQVITII